ncbi:MAG: hypothetical protein ACI8Q1_002465 [Parvicella sp.]|jgi:hypothetical protein
MNGLHSITEEFLKLLDEKTIAYEAHDPKYEDDDDIVWIVQQEDESCDGEYISFQIINPEAGICYVSHNSSHAYGGDPTHWDKSGTSEELLKDLVKYFVERRAELQTA